MSLRARLLASVVVFAPFGASQAWAQAEQASGATPASNGTHSRTHKSAARQADTQPETVVVTSSRRAQNIKAVPESVSVVSRAQIQNSAAQTIDQILRNVASIDLPNINAQDNFSNSNFVAMRGLSGTRALVLLDGIPLHDTFFGTVQWNRVPLENIQQVEVVRGGDATLWGNYAMGGVINILTQTPTKNEVLLSGGSGTYGTDRVNLYASYVPISWARFSFDYGYNQTLGYDEVPKDVTFPIDRKTEDLAHNVQATADFDIADGLEAGLKVFWSQNYQPLQLVELSKNYAHFWTFAGHVTKTFSDASTLTANAFHDREYFYTDNVSVPSFSPNETVDYVQDIHNTPSDDVGGSIVWQSKFPTWVKNYSLGIDAHQISGSDDDLLFTDPVQNGPVLYSGQEIASGHQIFAGGFADITLKPVKPLDIKFSARYQYYHSYDGAEAGIQGNQNFPGRAAFDFLPRLSVRYRFNRYFALRGAGYEAFRAPTLDELYRTVQIQTGIFYSNPSLSPEKLQGGEVGFDFDAGPFSAQVTGFYNHINNLITSRDLTSAELPAGDYFGSENINAGSAKSEGMEAEAHWRIAQGLVLVASYTYAYSPILNDIYDLAAVGEQQMDVPRHKLAASLAYAAPSGWKITPEILWETREWGDNDHTLPLNEHFLLNLTGSYPITRRIEAFAQIQNLTNRTYIGWNDGGSPAMLGEPLTFFGGARIKLY